MSGAPLDDGKNQRTAFISHTMAVGKSVSPDISRAVAANFSSRRAGRTFPGSQTKVCGYATVLENQGL